MSKKTSALLAAACATASLGSSAYAVDLTSSIINPEMELRAGQTNNLRNGQDAFFSNGSAANTDGWRTWADSENGTSVRVWNPSSTNRWTNANNEFFDSSWGGNDASGNPDGQVLVVRTQTYDYIGSTLNLDDYGNRTFPASATSPGGTYNWQADSGGIRNFEAAAQLLTETFDPTAKYTLSVNVGRLHADGFNTGVTVLPGPDLTHGTGDDVAGASSRFVNDAPVLYNGYFVDLLAGGVTGPNSSFGGWVYGSSNPLDAHYIGEIASDDTGLTLAEDSWGTSVLQYTPGSGPDLSALAGKSLVIRLGAHEAPDHKNTTAVAFDDVVLTMIKAGDADEDDDVDSDDFNLLAFNFGNAGTWAEGDFDGDGTVDSDDFNLLAFNFGFNAAPPSAAEFAALESFAASIAVPEPGSIALLGLGGLLLAHRRRRA